MSWGNIVIILRIGDVRQDMQGCINSILNLIEQLEYELKRTFEM